MRIHDIVEELYGKTEDERIKKYETMSGKDFIFCFDDIDFCITDKESWLRVKQINQDDPFSYSKVFNENSHIVERYCELSYGWPDVDNEMTLEQTVRMKEVLKQLGLQEEPNMFNEIQNY